MKSVSRGYTIIEIMVVLAISSVLVLMAMTFLNGNQSQTEFSQSMRDLQSQVQSWIDSVPNGDAYGSIDDTYCHLSGNIKIDTGGRPANASPDCIFLGKAIQFNDKPSTSVYAYSVFGRRLDASDNLTGNIQDAEPEPAAGAGGPKAANLTETYTLKSGATLRSIINSSGITAGGEKSHLAGFYLSLNTDQAIGQNGNSNLIAYQYPLGNAGLNDNSVIRCIENNPPDCRIPAGQTAPAALDSWQLCFENNGNGRTALLTISSSANGFDPKVQLEFKACP
jgi:prepilin-type N-terminal cleavage/methylation domain-containing protein